MDDGRSDAHVAVFPRLPHADLVVLLAGIMARLQRTGCGTHSVAFLVIARQGAYTYDVCSMFVPCLDPVSDLCYKIQETTQSYSAFYGTDIIYSNPL